MSDLNEKSHESRKNDVDDKFATEKDIETQLSSSDDHDLPIVYTDDGVDTAYDLKCQLVNRCLQEEIGFGRYQKQLFVLSGLGWAADNIWLQGVAIVLPQIQKELQPVRVEFASLALYCGLIVGASFFGMIADVIGRKLSFNITLFIAGVFGIACGAAPNFVTFAALVACLGAGVGGNLPVDGALYLEHIPQSHQWTLTLLSAWWALGQLVASLIAWGFIGKFSCPDSTLAGECLKADNMGWRYTFYALGSITFMMFVFRFIIFDLKESSKYLIAKGRDEDAIAVLSHIAKRNGRSITLTVEKLQSVGVTKQRKPKNTLNVVASAFHGISLSHVKPLFSHRRLAINSTITILLWGLIGLAYPLFNAFLPLYLHQRVPAGDNGTDTTYRNYSIISALGIPGSLIACCVVDWTRASTDGNPASKWAVGGRKMTMAVATTLTGVFLFLFTTSKSEAAVLGFSCASAVTQNAMYGVLFAYTPEVFPGPHRGTADAICSAFNRITGILAPVIKIVTTDATGASAAGPNVPIFVSASLFLVAAVLMVFLPIETAGRAAL